MFVTARTLVGAFGLINRGHTCSPTRHKSNLTHTGEGYDARRNNNENENAEEKGTGGYLLRTFTMGGRRPMKVLYQQPSPLALKETNDNKCCDKGSRRRDIERGYAEANVSYCR